MEGAARSEPSGTTYDTGVVDDTVVSPDTALRTGTALSFGTDWTGQPKLRARKPLARPTPRSSRSTTG